MDKYRTALSMGILSSMEYRFDFFIGFIGMIFPIVIQVFLWLAVYGGTGDEEMYGYNFSQMIAYVVIASLVGRVVNTGVENTINNDIHSGGLAKYLVKPIGYIPFRMINTFGTKLFSLGVLVVFAVATITVLHLTIGFTLALEHLLLFIPALLLGLALNFFVFFIVSMMAFWLTEVGAFFMTIQVIIMVLSGGVFPITVLGDGFVSVMSWLPFIYTTYFPIRVLTGAETLQNILFGLGIQILWIAILSVVSVALWRRGVRRYVAGGG